MKAHTLVFVSLLALAGTLRAEPGDGILGRDNIEFARALNDAGYSDLAEMVCAAIDQAPGSTAEEKSGASALRLDIHLGEATSIPDLDERRRKLAENLKEREKIISEQPELAEKIGLREDMPRVYQYLAEATIAAIEREQDQAKIATLRDEGAKVFTDGLRALTEKADSLREKRDDPKFNDQYMLATYNLARLKYFRALLYAPGDPNREIWLNKSIEAQTEFLIDYSETLLAFEGLIFQGLAHWKLNKPTEALTDFNDAIALREYYKDPNTNAFDFKDIAVQEVDVIANAFVQKTKLLVEMDKKDEAIATAREFLTQFPDNLSPNASYSVQFALIEAAQAMGDDNLATEEAKKVRDRDPNGYWGAKANEVLGQTGGSVAGDELLRVARTQIDGGDVEQGLASLRRILSIPTPTPKSKSLKQKALILCGYCYGKLDQPHEASAAYDAAAEVDPTSEDAPDAIWRALNADLDCQADERKAFYNKRVNARMALLAEKYPKHPAASRAQLVQAKQLADDKKFAEAAEMYGRVAPDNESYPEAQFQKAILSVKAAKQLLDDGKAAEAKPMFARGEQELKAAVELFAKLRENTLDKALQTRLDSYTYNAQTTLASLYVSTLERPADALALLDKLEDIAKGDPEKSATLWGMRIQALKDLNRLDDAEKLLENLLAKQESDPKAPPSAGTCAAARKLASAFDQQAVDLEKKDPQSKDLKPLWRKTCRYYVASQQANMRSQSSAVASELEQVANRVFALALNLNDVPQTSGTFAYDPKGVPTEPQYLEDAVKLYTSLLDRSPSYRGEILRASALGFLGKWAEAAESYARIFDNEQLVDPKSGFFRKDVRSAKKELPQAYIDWAVAEHLAAKASRDKDRLQRAQDKFVVIGKNYDPTTQQWWLAKYRQILCFMDLGDYGKADIAMRDVERNSQDFDAGKFGFKQRFEALKKDIGTKAPRGNSPPPPGN